MTASNPISLETRALRYLARREHTRRELEQKLSSHECSQQVVTALLDELEQKGYLSNERFVEQITQMRRSKFGSRRIAHELKEKGVEEHLISDILSELKVTDFETARHIWQKKFGTPPGDFKERGKQIRFMMNRGFSLETINTILSQAKKEADKEET